LAELDDLRDAPIVDHLDTHHFSDVQVGPHLARVMNQMVNSLERYLEKIIFVIVCNTQERQPFCLDLIAQVERSDLYLDPRAEEALRQPIEEYPPFRLVDLPYSHRSLSNTGLLSQAARAVSMHKAECHTLTAINCPSSAAEQNDS
jgi:hypothetical protein